MIPAPDSSLCSLLIHADALHGQELVVSLEETRLLGRVGEEDENGDGDDDGEETAEEEDDLVRVEDAGADVGEAPGEEASKLVAVCQSEA